MSIYGIEKEVKYGDYKFSIAYDSGNGCSLDQRDIHWSIKEDGKWTDPKFVRSFYFEDMQLSYMRNFCRKFAEDAEYRELCLKQETDWAIRDALFERNAFHSFWHPSPVTAALGDVPDVWNFIKAHYQSIIAEPEYARLKALDSAFEPSREELDPGIAAAVHAFNRIPGVETRFSCQGVSAMVRYQGMDFLVDTPHARYAYISFKTIPESVLLLLRQLVQEANTMVFKQQFESNLESTGDNLAFRRDAEQLAKRLFEMLA
jgi:hypothetical protein